MRKRPQPVSEQPPVNGLLTDGRKGSRDNFLAGARHVISRRDALHAGVLTACAAGLGALEAPPGARAAAEAAEGVSHRDWKRLADALSSQAALYRPGESAYRPLAIPFNHRYSGMKPAGIVACAPAGTSAKRSAGPVRSVFLPSPAPG